jgi:cytochrome c peroxidase
MVDSKVFRGYRIVAGLALFGVAWNVAGCSTETDGFSSEEWTRIKLIQPLSTTQPANPYDMRGDDPVLAKLGQKLFFEVDAAEAITVAGPSGNVGDVGKVGCVTCHGSPYFTDARMLPQSHGRSWLAHNTPTMFNLGYNKWTLWTGRFDSLIEHGSGAIGTAATPLAAAHYLYRKYKDEYNAAFPDHPLPDALNPAAPDAARFPATGGPKTAGAPDGIFEKMTKDDQWQIHWVRANLAKLFDAYPRALVTHGSPFENFVIGKDRTEASFSTRARNGLRLFIGKGSCIDCHNGPLLSDGKFHNVGVTGLTALPTGSTTAAAADRGRGGTMAAVYNSALFLYRTNQMLPMSDQVAAYNGAGQFSDDPTTGLARLMEDDKNLCVTRDATANATTCAALFQAPNPMATPPVAGDPRYATCIAANTDFPACTKYDPSMEGAFRTPQLLNIAQTGPYFHTGEVKSLRDVVWHYNQGGGTPGTFVGTLAPGIRPLLLTDSEMDDIVEFLNTLTGQLPDPALTCNSAVDPMLKGAPANACGAMGAGPLPPLGGASGSAGSSGKGGGGGAGGGAGGKGGGGQSGGAGQGGTPASGGAPGTGGTVASSGGVSGSGGAVGGAAGGWAGGGGDTGTAGGGGSN